MLLKNGKICQNGIFFLSKSAKMAYFLLDKLFNFFLIKERNEKIIAIKKVEFSSTFRLSRTAWQTFVCFDIFIICIKILKSMVFKWFVKKLDIVY